MHHVRLPESICFFHFRFGIRVALAAQLAGIAPLRWHSEGSTLWTREGMLGGTRYRDWQSVSPYRAFGGTKQHFFLSPILDAFP